MAWCPKCRNEYVEGITVCADCKTDLVEELETETLLDEEFYSNEEAIEGFEPLPEEMLGKMTKAVAFEKKSDRAEEHKSSAVTLLGVGALGLFALVAYWLGFIPISLNTTSKYMITGVMGSVFILFIVIGLQSFKSAKTLSEEGKEEEKVEEEVLLWCRNSMHAQEIDAGILIAENETEEIKYFKRIEKVKMQISEAYPTIEDGFLEEIADTIYEEIFG